MKKFPPAKVMEIYHSNIENISKYPWYVLASPFFSKMNDCEDSSFEYIARELDKNYKPVNFKSKLFISFLKNFLIGCKTFLFLLLNSKFKKQIIRRLNCESLFVDYYINKKSNKTIIQSFFKKKENFTKWIVDSGEGYDKELDKYTIYELFSFTFLIFKSTFYLPFRKLGIDKWFLELSRNLNMYYSFKYYLAGKDIKKNNLKELHLLFEDQLRDRMIIQDNRNLDIYGYIHTSFIHHWRLNKFYSKADIYLPNTLVFCNHYSLESHLKNKFKNHNSKKIIFDFNKSSFNVFKENKISHPFNILFFLPNNLNLSLEMEEMANQLNDYYVDSKIIIYPHPNLNKFQDSKFIDTEHKISKNNDIVISSHRTNKGFQLYKECFNVIYYGSERNSFYIPYDRKEIPIKYAQNFIELKKIINDMIKN